MTTTDTAIFAGGCFWCLEKPFDDVDGVTDTTVGYTGGHVDNPSYQQVSAGNSGHIEAIMVTYDPNRVSFTALLDVLWRNIDPFDDGGQFCDRGEQYQAAIFYQDDAQQAAAVASKAAIEQQLARPVVTTIRPAAHFYPAEAYHQDYYQKNPVRYKFYRYSCGRDKRLGEVWHGH